MATVDPDDDSIDRWVVRRYEFDPARRERRHRVVAAFDNEAEFHDLIGRLEDEGQKARAAGQAEPTDHITGQHFPPGHRAAQQKRRLEWDIVTRRARRDSGA